MAESAVVAFLLNHLDIFLQQESSLLGGIRQDAESIRDELVRMRAFLRVADEKQDIDPLLQAWVDQVRDVAHDTEDVLDEFMLRFSRYHGDGFYGFLRKISCSIKNLKARRRIASRIHRIKCRVSQIAEGHQNYSSVSEQGSTSTTVNNTWYDSRGDALLLEEAELVAMDGPNGPKKQLIGWLAEGTPKLKVVSVLGMGGMGKTTLVKKVYDDMKVKNHFPCHAWITVSQSFDLRELLKDIIQRLFDEAKQPAPQRLETMDSNSLKAEIKDFLQQRRYVLVLDDVWSINAWDAFKNAFPDNNNGSRILLTTRIVSVASTSCVESPDHIFSMKPLSPEESWTLFCRKTFPGNCCPQHLEELSRGILEKCEGLPLAVVAISGALATKDKSRVDDWELFYRRLGAAQLEVHDKLESMKKILSLSYYDLPYYLKICFLYLGLFPEDYEIERMRLIRLWIAEGFVKEIGGMTMEEVAEGYLNELINRSLVQVAKIDDIGRLRECRIHDLFREVIITKSREQNIAAIVSKESTTWPEKVRSLSIQYTLGNLQHTNRFPQLRSLLMFSVEEPISKSLNPILFNGGVRLLKVLDLRGASLKILPNEVGKLFHLKYLSLRRTEVETLPKSIGKLENLETLDLKNTIVTELPVQILKLQRLRHLLVYRYGLASSFALYGFKAIVGIEGLFSLQKLCFIEANHESGRIVMGELGRLTQLRRLGIRELRREDGNALCSSLENLSNLQSLDVASVETNEIVDIQHLSSPPRSLQRLYLRGRLENLPHWITSLHNLVRLRLLNSKLMDDPLQSLQVLPNLIEIELRKAYQGEELCIRATGFQKLKILVLTDLEGLRWVRMEKGSLPRLEKLSFDYCTLVEDVPTGIEHLTNLKSLYLHRVSDKLKMFCLDRHKQGGDYWKIAHIPNIRMDLGW